MWSPPNPRFYFAIVWKIVRQVPVGQVTSYGQIASMIPPPPDVDPEQYQRLGARWVGTALRAKPDKPIPWWRVINSQGKISLPDPSGSQQRAHLLAEGVDFDAQDCVDFATFGWRDVDETWLEENHLLPPKSL